MWSKKLNGLLLACLLLLLPQLLLYGDSTKETALSSIDNLVTLTLQLKIQIANYKAKINELQNLIAEYSQKIQSLTEEQMKLFKSSKAKLMEQQELLKKSRRDLERYEKLLSSCRTTKTITCIISGAGTGIIVTAVTKDSKWYNYIINACIGGALGFGIDMITR